MTTRGRCLPVGWYPGTAEGVRAAVDQYLRDKPAVAARAVSGVAPHAGWAYSGAIAAEVVRALDPRAATIVVVGGHLGPRDGVLAAPEEAYETPLGAIPADLELLEALRQFVRLGADRGPDNTVEVQLPLIRCVHPGARVLGLRAPASEAGFELGVELGRLSMSLGRVAVLLGSTDLTHYGVAYGHTPHGTGPAAVRWVREVSDARMVRALVEMDWQDALRAAASDRSACSVGAALAAMGYASHLGAKRGELLRYATSLDAEPEAAGAQFVGYAGVIYGSDDPSARAKTSRATVRAASSTSGASG